MADEDEVREILQDIDAMSAPPRRASLDSASAASSLAWTLPAESELTRLEYENSFLQSTETLLESKCASLDSRLEEAVELLETRDAHVREQKQQIAAQRSALQQARGRITGLEDALRAREEEIAALRNAAHAGARDEDAALEMQIRATSRACEENQELHEELAQLRCELKQEQRRVQDAEAAVSTRETMEEELRHALARLAEAEDLVAREKRTSERAIQQARDEFQNQKLEIVRLQEQLRAAQSRETDFGERLHAQLEKAVENADRALRRADRAEAHAGQLERERDALRGDLAAERERRTQAETSAAEASNECARLQSELRLSHEERARDTALAKHEALTTEERLHNVEAQLQTERTTSENLRAKLAQVSRSFESALTQSKRTAGAAAEETRALRQVLNECETLLLERASRNASEFTGRPRTPLRSSDHTTEASRVIAQSAESLRMRKLRLSGANSPRASPRWSRAHTSRHRGVLRGEREDPLRRSALSAQGQDLSEMFASLASS